jgi:hypothetical protein
MKDESKSALKRIMLKKSCQRGTPAPFNQHTIKSAPGRINARSNQRPIESTPGRISTRSNQHPFKQ